MTKKRATKARATTGISSAFVPPYPPSWFDRLTGWVDRLPGPPIPNVQLRLGRKAKTQSVFNNMGIATGAGLEYLIP